MLITHGWHREFAAALRAKGHEEWSLHGGDHMELFTEAEFEESTLIDTSTRRTFIP